ncbi:hypothetical protein CHS0354_017641 [Potamilus streckersoni]|uniref:Uncharacterized protein n=1 Tax=Potamilus streckersoni TaxID=2493646 RepID=A0AAE0T269_9BIVA|nr:hypothetical protein CHS0354_017641 [Potamilus streckersoni]
MADVYQENVTVENICRYTVKMLRNVSGLALELRELGILVLRLEIHSETTLKNADQRKQETREIGKCTTPLGETLPKPHTLDEWSDNVTMIPEFSKRALRSAAPLQQRNPLYRRASLAQGLAKSHAEHVFSLSHVTTKIYVPKTKFGNGEL